MLHSVPVCQEFVSKGSCDKGAKCMFSHQNRQAGLQPSQSAYIPRPTYDVPIMQVQSASHYQSSSNDSNAKFSTTVCKYFAQGKCKDGAACKYLHAHNNSIDSGTYTIHYDNRPAIKHKNTICKYYLKPGLDCKEGDQCPYLHVHPSSPMLRGRSSSSYNSNSSSQFPGSSSSASLGGQLQHETMFMCWKETAVFFFLVANFSISERKICSFPMRLHSCLPV